MARIGLAVIELAEGVEVNVDDNNTVTVKDTKGELTRTISSVMEVNVEGNEITVARPNDEKENRSLHGTSRSLIANMVEGVSKGFQKELEIIGVGQRAQLQGSQLVIK